MQTLKADDLSGNWATLITVWNDDGSLDLVRLAHEIDCLLEARVDGIYSNGTAGEFHCQTETEFDKISQLLSEKCNKAGMPFQIGVNHMSAQISLERLRRVIALTPSALQVILPDWVPVVHEEAVAFLSRMSEEANGIGLVLYNPPHSKRVLSPREVSELREAVPGLIGLKTAGAGDDWYREMRDCLSKISVFIPGHLLASGIQQGASGAYSNVACLNPTAAQKWADLILVDMEAALELETRIRRFISDHISPYVRRKKYTNPACDRLLAQVGAWADVGDHVRWPYRSIPQEDSVRLRSIMEDILPEFA